MTLPAAITEIPYTDGTSALHCGTLFNGAVPAHVGAYTYNGVSVSVHYWNARWRNGAALNATRTPAQIVAANRMFPYGDAGAPLAAYPGYKGYGGPMSSAWVTPYMPQTGERPDIGSLTDPSAYFMLGASPAGMFAAALASGSFPHHYRDETTGKPVDLIQYPQANCYEQPGQGSPWFPRYPLNPDGSNDIGGGMVCQQAHWCDMAYMAYQATLDPWCLEEIQYAANYVVLCDAIHSTPTAAYMTGEYRGLAWGFGMLFKAHAATQDAEALGALPASCQPSSYWKKILDNQLTYYSKKMADPTNQLFRLLTGPGMFGPWQVDYSLTTLALGILTGHSDWAPIYLWALKNAIDRTSGNSGYPVGWGTAYYMDTAPTWYDSWLAMSPPVSPPPTPAQVASFQADPYNAANGYKPPNSSAAEYILTTRAALVMADYLEKKGLINVRAMHPELDKCLANVQRMVVAGGWMNARVSVISSAVPVDPTQPPAGGITLPTATTIKIGQSQLLGLTVTPSNGDISSLTYHSTPDGIVSILPGDKGPTVKGLKAGVAKVLADVNGADANGNPAKIEAECDVTVTVAVPLVTALSLVPVS